MASSGCEMLDYGRAEVEDRLKRADIALCSKFVEGRVDSQPVGANLNPFRFLSVSTRSDIHSTARIPGYHFFHFFLDIEGANW